MSVQVNITPTIQSSRTTTPLKSSSSTSVPVQTAGLTTNNTPDTFEKNNKSYQNKKKLLFVGIGTAIVAIVGIIVAKNVKNARKAAKAAAEEAEKKAQAIKDASARAESTKAETPNVEEPKKPEIKTEKNGDPKAIIGCDAEEAKALRKEYDEHQKLKKTFKPETEMTQEEIEARCKWYREVDSPLMGKIRNYNISIVDKKEFSPDPTKQVKEKHDYLHYDVMLKMMENESSYYDGLEEFEKYGKREECRKTGVSTLTDMSCSMPKNPT